MSRRCALKMMKPLRTKKNSTPAWPKLHAGPNGWSGQYRAVRKIEMLVWYKHHKQRREGAQSLQHPGAAQRRVTGP